MLLTMIYLFLLVSVVLLLNLLIAQLNQTYEYINKASRGQPWDVGDDTSNWSDFSNSGTPGPHKLPVPFPHFKGFLWEWYGNGGPTSGGSLELPLIIK